jgi:ABC-2 type transport system permease protein
MLSSLRRKTSTYAAFAAVVPKQFTAYTIWIWMDLTVQVVWLIVMSFFWRAVYEGQNTLGGLAFTQTLNYILLAQVLTPLLRGDALFTFGHLVREGMIAVELLRPIDFQGRYYAEALAGMATQLVIRIPLLIVAVLFFDLHLPSNPLVWGAFLLALLLGHAILFCFDWIFGCLSFVSTEIWGLSVVREGLATFFSGALIPLVMMPGWLRSLTEALPFAQTLYAPVAILTGITPLEQAPFTWLVQLAWLLGLLIASRLLFRIAVGHVVIQGG